MSHPPPVPADYRDDEHIKLLAIFHFVWAGLLSVGLLFLFAHYFIVKTMLDEVKDSTTYIEQSAEVPDNQIANNEDLTEEERMAEEEAARVRESARRNSRQARQFTSGFFGAFLVFYLVAGAVIILAILLNIVSGRYMLKKRNKVFSMVVAGFNCVSFPLGTILGVFTFVVLSRQSVTVSYLAQKNEGPRLS